MPLITETARQDLRLGLRQLRQEKGTAALSVTVLAIGICAVATLFSVIQGALLRGFAFPNGERLVSVRFIDPSRTTPYGVASQVSSLDYLEMRQQQKSLERTAAYINGATVNMTVDGRALRFTGAYVTDEFFDILGVHPILGRDFQPADNTPGAPKVAILSYELWQRELGGDPDVLGKAVRLNGRPASIVGVMDKGFAFPVNEELWIPLFNEYPPMPRSSQDAPGNYIEVLGLARSGGGLAEANAELGAIASRLAAAYPETNKAYDTAQVQPLIKAFTPPQLGGTLLAMFAFCVGVLVLACANVMNMQLARATLRARELAVRSSLGATRARLMRQMLTESGLVAALGAVLGVLATLWTTRLLMDFTHRGSDGIPSWIAFRVDGQVLAFIAGAAVLSTLLSGLVPAYAASRANASAVLNDASRGNTSRLLALTSRGLVVFQIVITSILLVGSFLELQSILKQYQVDHGYDTKGVLSARVALMEGDYPSTWDKKIFFDRTLETLRSDPEYAQAALTTRLRMVAAFTVPIEIEGKEYAQPRDRPTVSVEAVSDGYFDTLGTKLLFGRDFRSEDSDQKLPVAIVNAAFAHKHFGSTDAIGRRFRTSDGAGEVFGPWRTVVGVVSDVRMTAPFNDNGVDATGFYVPFFSSVFGPAAEEPIPPQFATLVVRPQSGRDADTLSKALFADVAKIDPNLPLYFVGTPARNLDAVLAQNRVVAGMFSIFGVVAVVLSAAGLYGVMAFSVNRRHQELGTRMVFGADRARILRLVLKQCYVQIGLGLAIGLALAFAIARLAASGLSQVLYEVSPSDPRAYLLVVLLITVVGFIAAIVPARRATRVDPASALRAE